MSLIDNEEGSVFQFDPEDRSDTPVMNRSCIQPTDSNALHLSLSADAVRQVEEISASSSNIGKGKGVSRPVPIALPARYNSYDVRPSSPGSSHQYNHPLSSAAPSLTPSSPTYPVGSFDSTWEPSTPQDGDDLACFSDFMVERGTSDPILGKGKDKVTDLPPSLPPLSFPPTEIDYSHAYWPSPALFDSTPGASSYGSGFGSPPTPNIINSPTITPIVKDEVPAPRVESSPIIGRIPSRRHSLSDLSVHSSHSVSVRSLSRVKVKLGASNKSSFLGRKFLSKKSPTSPLTSFDSRLIDSGIFDAGQGNCFLPWRADGKLSEQPESLGKRMLRRSYSSPISTAENSPAEIERPRTPEPPVVRDLFDELLPRELRIQVLRSLVSLHAADYVRGVAAGEWTVNKASSSKSKWVGKDKGVRELVKLSRVSRSWQLLVFDGQLWEDIDLRAFPSLPGHYLLRLTQASGPFVTSLNLSGHTRLSSEELFELTDSLCLTPYNTIFLPLNQLTTVNLRGCTSLTTRSLHHLIMRSPSLQTFCVRGLPAVTNTTCDLLAVYCPQLINLDVSQCPNMTAVGVRDIASTALARREHLRLKELRACGLKHVDDKTMEMLGKAAPFLEVLDLSYARQLHNSALEAFVACPEYLDGEDLGVETVLLNAREAGRDINDINRYRRRITRLRHLSLSSCLLLTDMACSNLAHAVPDLEFLELAGIGEDLKDEGIIRLLRTTPMIQRLDLEDAADISDAVIAAVTPGEDEGEGRGSKSDPGHALEQLVISYAGNVTENALLSLVRHCENLTVLEADNTRIGAAVLREFVQLSRERRLRNAKLNVVDCRGIGEALIKEVADMTRPRMGWAAYESRKLKFIDGRDGLDDSGLKSPVQDECDEERVVVKSFYSWQAVDTVAAAREKKRKANARRVANSSNESTDSIMTGRGGGTSVTRWWSPGGRRSGRNSPPSPTEMNSNEGCTIM